MALLQPRLHLKVAQRQVLTPGLVQMVSLLALNKQELKEMIDAEILENPVLEELDEAVPLIDDVRTPEEAAAPTEEKKESDPFDEIDFGSYFQDYLDPGYRTPQSMEISEKPSFENFLSKATTLTDHMMWQLGSLHLSPGVREAAELIIGNLNEDGYLTASDDELLEALALEKARAAGASVVEMPVAASHGASSPAYEPAAKFRSAAHANGHASTELSKEMRNGHLELAAGLGIDLGFDAGMDAGSPEPAAFESEGAQPKPTAAVRETSPAMKRDLAKALKIVRALDPPGIAARDLRECLLTQLDASTREAAVLEGTLAQVHSEDSGAAEPVPAGDDLQREAGVVMALARRIIDEFLPHLLKRDLRELSRLTGQRQPRVQSAIEVIRRLDPKPGQRYNREQPRLIEPDVAFVKRDGEYVIVMNDEEIPALRLNHGYRRMLAQEGTEREVRDYVKERYRSAMQLMRNIEQRKNTILRTCEVIVRRQQEFLEGGVDALKPMMIKDVAEEIGVHASTVSRAVANKYVHTPQGVFELRFFFSEGVNGPEGAETPLLLLKRKVKKMIEEEDARKPLTDDAIASLLQSQGIAVNRRTVAKYREDMGIPSTHQRRVRI